MNRLNRGGFFCSLSQRFPPSSGGSGLFQFGFVADQYLAFIPVPVVKSIALAIFIIFACCTGSLSGPAPVAERSEPGLPYLMEIVLVDISLDKSAVDVGAG